MRTARVSRANIGLATAFALALTATFLAQASSEAPLAQAKEPASPAFLAWGGEVLER